MFSPNIIEGICEGFLDMVFVATLLDCSVNLNSNVINGGCIIIIIITCDGPYLNNCVSLLEQGFDSI